MSTSCSIWGKGSTVGTHPKGLSDLALEADTRKKKKKVKKTFSSTQTTGMQLKGGEGRAGDICQKVAPFRTCLSAYLPFRPFSRWRRSKEKRKEKSFNSPGGKEGKRHSRRRHPCCSISALHPYTFAEKGIMRRNRTL